LELLKLTGSHPAGHYQIKAKVQSLRHRYQVDHLPEIEAGIANDLQNVIEVIQNELAALVLAGEQWSRGAEGQIISPAPALRRAGSGVLPHSSALVEPLTSRELEILQLIADGLSNPEIAAALILTVGTVKAHTHHIYSKLNATNRVQAIARARGLGLL
jgi:ATP/maltotriose-dependent transcriptional regulator MalT